MNLGIETETLEFKKSTGELSICEEKVREKYGKSTGNLNASQKRIIDFLQENAHITNKDEFYKPAIYCGA